MTLGRVPLLTKRKDLLQKIQCASVLLLFLWTWNPDHRETTMKFCDFLYEGLISRNNKSTLFLHSCDWGFKPYISLTQISWNKHSSGLYNCSKEFGIRHYFSISKGTLALLIYYRGKEHLFIPWFTIVSGLFLRNRYIQTWLWAKTRCIGEGLKLLGNVLHPSASHVHLCWR